MTGEVNGAKISLMLALCLAFCLTSCSSANEPPLVSRQSFEIALLQGDEISGPPRLGYTMPRIG